MAENGLMWLEMNSGGEWRVSTRLEETRLPQRDNCWQFNSISSGSFHANFYFFFFGNFFLQELCMENWDETAQFDLKNDQRNDALCIKDPVEIESFNCANIM